MPLFESRTELERPPEEVFAFLTRPANLQAIAPKDMDLVFVDAPEVLSLGSRLVFKVQGFGVVQQIEHEIISFDPPRGFTEKMTRGPLAYWQHDYLLEPHGNGAILWNRIQFEPPGGLLGMILTAERVLDHLEQSHARRSAALKQALAR
jgi:ligand-binding SRPBCC domain-containing protein